MHFETPIYATVEQLRDLVIRAVAQFRRDIKPVLGVTLIEEVGVMAILVRRAAVARGTDKLPFYGQLTEVVEYTEFLLKGAFNTKHLPASMYAAANSYLGLARQATHSHRDRARIANLARRRGFAVDHPLTKVYS